MGAILYTPKLYFPEELRRNSVYSIILLSYPAELRYHMPPEIRKEKKGTPNERVSTSTNLIYIRISYGGLHKIYLITKKQQPRINEHERQKMLTNELYIPTPDRTITRPMQRLANIVPS